MSIRLLFVTGYLDMDGHCMEQEPVWLFHVIRTDSPDTLSPVHFTIAIHAESGNLINFCSEYGGYNYYSYLPPY